MRSRPLSFADALQLLGERDDPTVEKIGRLAGIGAGVVTVASLGTVDFFALRDEAVRWGDDVVGGLREKLRGLSRFDRTQRLVAAHAVIVVTSFYEALDEVSPELMPARLTAAEQVTVTTGGSLADKYADLVEGLLAYPPPMPAAHLPFEETIKDLRVFYVNAALATQDFIRGLAGLIQHPGRHGAFDGPVVDAAVLKYAEAYRRLMLRAPEFGVWTNMIEAQATRHLIGDSAAGLSGQLAELRAGVARIADQTLDATRTGLGKSYRARLARSILSSTDAPPHAVLPTLREGYVEPRGLVALAGAGDLPAAESWWKRALPVPDVKAMVLAHLTAPRATGGPLVVLGQPGSGKSVLTRMLAADLPEADFLVVRVELRNVHADSSPQAQIESAIYQMLGERVTWPELVRSAGPALPVVIMDGFDELLQATGVNRADYLEQLREFQQREADLDRPVAVLVTSRTVVADRARFPQSTVVIRLEPFDADQAERWLAVWNGLNEAGLRARSLQTLSPEVALKHAELASQPLLLLLLALYDAGANALQSDGGGIGEVELYDRLFQDFIQREVKKHDDGGSADQRTQAIEAEWHRLSAVALAMLNRGGDIIHEAELNADIPHLLHVDDLRPAGPESMRRPLTVSQLLVGRFFFIHESQAARDTGAAERTFEFLHATFGDFLAARQIVGALTDLAEERQFRSRRPGAALDAGYLYAVTSFVTVARRVPLFEFCRGLFACKDPDVRRRCRELVLELLPDAGYPHPTWSLAGYEPRRKTLAARHAAFSANLVCFAVMLSDGRVDVLDLVGEPVVLGWKSLALLWQSQLEVTDRQQLWQSFRVAWRLDTDPSILEIRVEDGADVHVYESIPWPIEDRPTTGRPDPGDSVPDLALPADSTVGRFLRRSAFVQTAFEEREFLYAQMPYWRTFSPATPNYYEGRFDANANLLLQQILLTPPGTEPPADRGRWLRAAAAHSLTPFYGRLVLRQITEEADQLDEQSLLTVIRVLRPVHTASNPDLVAKLAVVATASGYPSDSEVMLSLIPHLPRADPSAAVRAEFRDHLIRAFAGAGLTPPEWALNRW